MKKLTLFVTLLVLLIACQPTVKGPWADFIKCGSNACVTEGIAVKDALLKDPKGLLEQFQQTYAKGEDHLIGWLELVRDSVLYSDKTGSVQDRFAVQQAILDAVRPYENDAHLGEVAKTITGTLGELAIASELEDDIVEPMTIAVMGTYTYELPNEAGSGTLQVSQTASNEFNFKLEVVAGPPAYNQGMMEGTATLNPDGTATYTINEYGGECTLEFTWSDIGVSIKTLKGDSPTCGFGNNVVADGDYTRQGFDDPMLSKADAKIAKNLTGDWQSTADPKSQITIVGGKYSERYDGELMGEYLCLFFPKCPGSCNPMAPTPCIQVIGQDDVCYTVIKADGATLELSPIGGTGNTLVYKKMK